MKTDAATILNRIRERDRARQNRYIARRKSGGHARMLVWLPADMIDYLNQRADADGTTRSQLVADIIRRERATVNVPLAVGQAKPDDRAKLARIGHDWKARGMTASAIAAQWNLLGWTPDQIPKDPGTKPRADSPTEWTLKLVSQLLTRDYPDNGTEIA